MTHKGLEILDGIIRTKEEYEDRYSAYIKAMEILITPLPGEEGLGSVYDCWDDGI